MKKYLNNKEERLDTHFKDSFENFEETPSNNVWENIEAGIDIEGFDKIFNSKLTDNEVTPSPEVWETVKEGIPLNLYVKKHLENLMKIAAVLLCFMSLTLYFTIDKNQSSEYIAVEETVIQDSKPVVNTPLPIIEEVEEKDDFVYEIKKRKKKKRTKKAKKEQDVDVDELWKLLMEDDEDFADVMDEDTKLEILSPPVRLPLIEEPFALQVKPAANEETIDSIENLEITSTEEETYVETETIVPDLKIWVPLVVVEKHEIEKLISIYDQAEASKKINNISNQ